MDILEHITLLPTELKIAIFSFIEIETRIELWKDSYIDLRNMIEKMRTHGKINEILRIFYNYFPNERTGMTLYSIVNVGVYDGGLLLFRLDNSIVDRLLKRVSELEMSYAYRERIFKMLLTYTYYYYSYCNN
uniref:Uncharacterized protein n=1 Tax=viral metagenome TaxID=1070528 RepID=A0A6C0DPF7_9ZZZZ